MTNGGIDKDLLGKFLNPQAEEEEKRKRAFLEQELARTIGMRSIEQLQKFKKKYYELLMWDQQQMLDNTIEDLEEKGLQETKKQKEAERLEQEKLEHERSSLQSEFSRNPKIVFELIQSKDYNQVQKLQKLLALDIIPFYGEIGRDLVFYAVSTGCLYEPIINQFLDSGGDINMQHPTTGDPLTHIAVRSFQTHILQFLLQKGANPNIKSNEGLRLLQYVDHVQHESQYWMGVNISRQAFDKMKELARTYGAN